MTDLNVTLVQHDILWRDPQGNRDALAKILAPLSGKADLVVLPETFSSGFCKEAAVEAETMDGPTVAWIKHQAKTLQAAVTGSVQIRDGKGVYNRLLWADPGGSLQHYDKRHLFRMAKEHETYAPGNRRLTVELKGWRVCPLVCYDLRFPVFARNRFGVEAPGRFDYDLLIFVANWPAARRYAWQTLLRARHREPGLRGRGQPRRDRRQQTRLRRRQRRLGHARPAPGRAGRGRPRRHGHAFRPSARGAPRALPRPARRRPVYPRQLRSPLNDRGCSRRPGPRCNA